MTMRSGAQPESESQPASVGTFDDATAQLLLVSAAPYLADRHQLSRLRRIDGGTGAVLGPVWREMAEFGWLSLTLPDPWGGSGLDIRCAAPLCQLLGSLLVPEPLVASGLMPAALLSQCPDSTTRNECVAHLLSGAVCLTLAWQESVGQVDAASTARLDAQMRLTGRKIFVPLSFPDSILLVDAVVDGEAVIVALSADAPGVRVTRQLMGDGSHSATVTFDAAQVTWTPLASGPKAVLALRQALNVGTLGVCAALVGLADGALALTLDYLRTRTQFGQPIGAFQVLQHRAVDFHIGVQLAKASLQQAIRLASAAEPGQAGVARGNVAAAASAAKARCARTALLVTKGATQMFGASGFTEDADIGLYLRTALHWSAWLGNETMHRRRYLQLVRAAA